MSDAEGRAKGFAQKWEKMLKILEEVDTWPRMGDRLVCNRVQPMPKDAPEEWRAQRWIHTDAVVAADFGETLAYKCPACGLTWTEEPPQ